MTEYRRIYLPLSKEEFVALQNAASDECRHPRDQVRWLLRRALGLAEPLQENVSRDTVDCRTQRAAIAA